MRRRIVPYLVGIALIVLYYCLDDSPIRLTKLVLMLGLGLAFSVPRKLTQRVLAAIGVLLLVLMMLGRDVVLSMQTNALSSPYQEVQAPEQQVVLGGQKVFIRTEGLIGTASFYPGDGTMVSMAHSLDRLEVGLAVGMNITGGKNIISTNAMVLANDKQGVLVGLPEGTKVNSDTISLGGTADISVGEKAVVHSTVGGTFEVTINGYRMDGEHQLLVITPLKTADRIIPGMSGSPVVQNGKLVGLIYSRFDVPLQSGNFGMARLAADVYDALVGHTEWDPITYGLEARDPASAQLVDDQVREAHLALIEKHEVDLGKFEVITNRDAPISSYTPAVTGKDLLQSCIQDAEREYGQLTPIPSLALYNPEGRVMLVGFALEDGKTIVVKYSLLTSGWNKSVTRK